MSKQNVLIIDDNFVNRKVLCKILSSSYGVIEAENGEVGLNAFFARHESVCAILLDIIMPVMDGYTFLDKAKSDERFKNVPIIVTTGSSEAESEIKALQLGAWDFVTKPYNAEIIKFRLANAIYRSQLSAYDRLKYLAEFDTLTGIFNQSKFYSETRKMLNENPELSFVFIRFDIDRFQLINSFFGRSEGDKLLKFIAKGISQETKGLEHCTYGRIESDIFCMCFINDEKEIQNMIAVTRAAFAEFNPSYDIVPSYGIYYIDDPSIPVETMKDRATLAAKSRKGSYVNLCGYYDDKMSAQLYKEQEITNEMTVALAERQFIVYLQPKYNIQSNTLSGAEALVRWVHPTKGMISPGDFIPVFERNGFISKLDYYMWEEVCKLIRRWMDEGKKLYPVSVNVSRVNLYNPKLIELIEGLVKKYGIPSSVFNLELTESAYTENPLVMSETMARLQRDGYVIMMDDFGSGYSSLNVLKDIAVDIIKIDMRFFSKTKIPGRGESIIASVVRMTKWLHIPVIAEGVETKEQVDFLRGIGCEYVQGFYFARPMPVKDFEALSEKYAVDISDKTEQIADFDVDMLWSSGNQFETMFSNVSQAICFMEYGKDGDLELLRVNEYFYQLMGCGNEIFSRGNMLNLFKPNSREILLQTIQTTIQTKLNGECDFLIGKENQEKWIRARVKYVSAINGNSILFTVLTDVTELKKIDEELKKIRAKQTYRERKKFNSILIVDDVELNRALLKNIFAEQYTVYCANDGEDALKVLREKQYKIDLILLDIIMPKMDGEEFLKRREKDEQLSSIPVVAISADSRESLQKKTISLGVDDYVTKPFVPEVVKKRVENVIASAKKR